MYTINPRATTKITMTTRSNFIRFNKRASKVERKCEVLKSSTFVELFLFLITCRKNMNQGILTVQLGTDVLEESFPIVKTLIR